MINVKRGLPHYSVYERMNVGLYITTALPVKA
jgi:hypothetical protein